MPTSEDRIPDLGKAAFACPHCGAFTSHTWFSVFASPRNADNPPYLIPVSTLRDRYTKLMESKQAPTKVAVDDMAVFVRAREEGDPGICYDRDSHHSSLVVNMHFARCFVCRRESGWLDGELLYPARSIDAPEPNGDLPAEVRADYDEAARVAVISPRSAAALLRLAIQRVCSHVLERAGDINEMIGELVQRGLSPVIQQALDVVRVVGNEAVHPGTLDLRDDRDTVGKLFTLLNIIAENLITRPRQVAELYGMIPENKLKGIEVRDRLKALPRVTTPAERS